MKHSIKNRGKYLTSDDCIAYEANCLCGKKLGGWSEAEEEKNVEKHLRLPILLKELKRKIKECPDKTAASWGYQEGVLISAQDAQILIENLK